MLWGINGLWSVNYCLSDTKFKKYLAGLLIAWISLSGNFIFFSFLAWTSLKINLYPQKLSIAYFKYNLLYFLFSELFCRMKLNFWSSGIWPVMAWESSQAVVKPKSDFLKIFTEWAHLLFRKSQESSITWAHPFVIYGGKTIGGG